MRTVSNVRPAAREPQAAHPSVQLWEELAPSVFSLKTLLRRADREAIEEGAIPPLTSERIAVAWGRFEVLVNATLGDEAEGDDENKNRVGARLQADLHPYLLLSENAERWYAKPRGYAGDFLSIAKIYENAPRGHGRLGAIVDQCFLELAAARAVRNRRGLLAKEIRSVIDANEGRRARVTSMACGPAEELFDVYATLPDASCLRSTLIDMDLQALAHVADRRDRGRLRTQMSLANENLVHLATGRRQLLLENQDLVYSVGLIDYFDDDMVVKLLGFVHRALRPGGRVLLGNFHPRNPTKALMDHVLEWRLVHRTEEDMDRLFRRSAFGRAASRVVFEEQRINLFAECVKE